MPQLELFTVTPVVIVEPDDFLGFVARATVLGRGYVIVTACHARTAADAEAWLRRMLSLSRPTKTGRAGPHPKSG
jgi:hypothetical protein